MAKPSPPEKTKLICGMLAGSQELLKQALAHLEAEFGPADILSEIIPFNFTQYYDQQMGSGLLRQFAAFQRLIDPDQIVAAKLVTNQIEANFSAAAAPDFPQRPVNLDPGYIEQSKLVLASMKKFSHRIYLGRGVYGEVTLMYRKTRWESLPWTFPDYGSGAYFSFLNQARKALREAQEIPK